MEAKELKPGVKLGVTPKSEGVGIWKDKILPDITTKRREMVLPSVDKQDNKNVEITSISNNGESGITRVSIQIKIIPHMNLLQRWKERKKKRKKKAKESTHWLWN